MFLQAIESSPFFEEQGKADPTTVASIILGGGAGTRLFPLTSRRAKPAVKEFMFLFCFFNVWPFLIYEKMEWLLLIDVVVFVFS